MLNPKTIVAVSTPPGRGGIGVVRLSGTQSLCFTRLLLQDSTFNPSPRTVSLKPLIEPETGQVLDSALITRFKAPHSFTGEDVIEISCHGSPVILLRVVSILLEFGALAAEPGEFTLRALSNKRMNLAQAEAVRDLIESRTITAAKLASRQLGGELSFRLQPLKSRLLDIIVQLESAIEFVEDDLPNFAVDKLQDEVALIAEKIAAISATYHTGRLFRDGLKVALVGRPNVGKSSLFNGLLDEERAIVADTPGTTRDTVTEFININGIPIQLTDTAGIRSSTNVVELMGIERTRRALVDADLALIVLDGSEPLKAEDEQLLAETVETQRVVAINKSDLKRLSSIDEKLAGSHFPTVHVSAITGGNLDELRKKIIDPFFSGDNSGEGLITNARHFDLLSRSVLSLRSARRLLEARATEEIVLVELHNALRLLGEITGETTSDDVLTQIFATFCIGK